jgi:UDP-GlcNAc:undecaprenyl-phosphate GlcNAc-1-phosphate transferase
VASVEVLALAFAVSAGWCLVAMRLGPRLGYVDRVDVDPLKVHKREAVPLGGVGLYLAVVSSTLLAGEFDPVLTAAATIVLALGVVDDRMGLAPRLRLSVQTLAAGWLVVGWGLVDEGVVYALIAGAVIVVAINAVNLFDGLDGLAGTTGVITAAGLGALALIDEASVVVLVAMAAALLGFLIFNWHPARVFLGDGGSYLLAFLLASEVIRLSPVGELELLATSAVLGVFVVDLAVTLIRRRARRQPLFVGDRSHVYDQLVDRGWSIQRVVLTTAAAQAVLVAVWLILGQGLGPVGGFVGSVLLIAAAISALLAAGFARAD